MLSARHVVARSNILWHRLATICIYTFLATRFFGRFSQPGSLGFPRSGIRPALQGGYISGNNNSTPVYRGSRCRALANRREKTHDYYSEIHLHMVWHVKESKPWLTPSVEKIGARLSAWLRCPHAGCLCWHPDALPHGGNSATDPRQSAN
jgi:hypothetical protein